MPCPAPSQPPGIFDFAAPHQVFFFIPIAILLPLSMLIARLYYHAKIHSVPAYRHIQQRHDRQTLLLLEYLTHGFMMLTVLLSSLAVLWGDALNQWYDAPFVDICSDSTTLAVYHQDRTLQLVLAVGAILALVIAIVLQSRHTRHLRLVHIP